MRLILLGLCGLCVAHQGHPGVLQPSTRSKIAVNQPHILLLVIDDLGFADISHTGGTDIPTPNIDSLLSSGLTLNRFYVQPTCTPTRAALLTGRYPFKSGLQDIQTAPPASWQAIPKDIPTLAEALKSAGYATHMIGKWHLGYSSWHDTPTGRGFDSHFGYLQGGEDYYSHILSLKGISGYDFWHNRSLLNVTGNYSLSLFEQQTLKTIAEHNKSQPLFLYLSLQTVHAPIQNPPPNAAHSLVCNPIKDEMRRTYCLMMLALDESLGVILDSLQESGLYDDTLGVFMTDNGGMVAFRDIFPLNTSVGASIASNAPLRAGKATCFEGGVRGVAGLFGGANVFPPALSGKNSSLVFHAIDVFPTLAAVGKARVQTPLDGVDMLAQLTDASKAQANRTVFININHKGETQSGVMVGDWKLVTADQVYDGYWIPGETTQYPARNCTNNDGYCLFNVFQDETETTDLSQQHPEIVEELKKLIADAVVAPDYRQEQSRTLDPRGLPALHHGVWAPWRWLD